MDSLETLPPVEETAPTPDEEAVMQRLFAGGGASDAQQASAPPAAAGRTFGGTLKAALLVTVAFLVVANPWSDTLFEKLPQCGESPALRLAVKTTIFFLLAALLVAWVL